MIEKLEARERPRERCLSHGASCLSLRECLAILIGSGPPGVGCLGVAKNYLRRSSQIDEEMGLFQDLQSGFIPPMNDLKGLGNAGKARLLASFELMLRYASFLESCSVNFSKLRPSKLKYKKHIENRIPKPLLQSATEWIGFIPIFSGEILGEFCLIEKGTRFEVNFDARLLFQKLFSMNAEAYLLFHLHPNGDPRASNEDYLLTKKLSALSEEMKAPLLGHCIVASGNFHWMLF